MRQSDDEFRAAEIDYHNAVAEAHERLNLWDRDEAFAWVDAHLDDEAPSIPLEEYTAAIRYEVAAHLAAHVAGVACTGCGPNWRTGSTT